MPVTGLVECLMRWKRLRRPFDEHGNGHTASMYSRNIVNLHAMARAINTSIFVKNLPTYAGLGLGERALPRSRSARRARGLEPLGLPADAVVNTSV